MWPWLLFAHVPSSASRIMYERIAIVLKFTTFSIIPRTHGMLLYETVRQAITLAQPVSLGTISMLAAVPDISKGDSFGANSRKGVVFVAVEDFRNGDL